MKKFLITGGCGFIGSAVVRRLMRENDAQIVDIDCLTYAATPDAREEAADNPRYTHINANICDGAAMQAAFETHQPDAVMHLAAESHVDRSIDGPGAFIQTNIVGTYMLLEAARRYYDALEAPRKSGFRFHHISTDEVFGELEMDEAPFSETTPYQPNSPYSASKASSDHLARAWRETYGLPVVISNCSNNYGPWQFPEKMIPVMIIKLLDGEKLPVYGDGSNRRDWLHVEDHAEALVQICLRGEIGESYNVGGRAERSNLELVRKLCALMDERRPQNAPHARLISFVRDRPGHDLRYAIDASKIERELGWTPAHDFDSGLAQTLDWYLANEDWLRKAHDGAQGRLGLSAAAPAKEGAA